ncbi:NAD-dependent epimerase/dehydratase family protein [Actinomyces viscosus]|uniref:NADH-flavin reductase n=1 Tax=Actinomyces viscosus TaxID=1656 RepID=A0A3S4Z3G3_ACTVI|nr:NAD(P)H-binding protein [Actinomyces viscosus]TFH52752.1 NAD-dependent epimerase/dehydratase family protein [Actinomyces viscosus]VEI18240.1 Putative NADH-flavin reductase [Actinomyces viscosus]
MRIVVLGATGMAGAAVANEAARRGHDVTAVSRRRRLQGGSHLTPCLLDVTDVDAVESLLKACDAAVVSLRTPPGRENDLAELTRGVLEAASRSGTPLLIIGGAAPLSSPTRPGTLVVDDLAVVPPAWRQVAQASLTQLRACQTHEYQGWVYLSPPALFGPGASTGSYRRGTTMLLVDDQGQSRISPEDLACAVVDELERPGGEQHFTVIASVPEATAVGTAGGETD